MDPPPLLLTLVTLCFGVFFAVIVDSQQDVTVTHPQPPDQSPPLTPPPGPGTSVPPPAPGQSHQGGINPGRQSRPLLPPSSLAAPLSSPPSPPPAGAVNSPLLRDQSPPPQPLPRPASPLPRRPYHQPRPSSSNADRHKGKKIGLMFLGIAAILQVCVVTFLGVRRRQLFKPEHEY